MSILLGSFVLALTTTLTNSCAPATDRAIEAQPPAAEQQPRMVAIADLSAKPEEYGGQTVRVRGKLGNAGTNYFKDRRIVLTDEKGNTLDVQPWLPLSRPGPSSRTQSGPTLAEFLDRQVELVGSLTRRTDASRKNEFIFQVKSAKILDA